MVIVAGIMLLAATKAGGLAVAIAAIYGIQAIILLRLGTALIKFATNVSAYSNGSPASLTNAFQSLGTYFRTTGILILLAIGLAVLMFVVAGSAMSRF